MPLTTFWKRVLRFEDLLALDLEFVNLRLSEDGKRLTRVDAAQPAFLVVHFPPQHIAEQAFQDPLDGVNLAIPVKALMAGPSRLAFKMPDGLQALPYTLEDLLDWQKLELSVPQNALPPGVADGPVAAPLAATETAIEFPYRLFLSPDNTETWVNSKTPVTHAGRTELWHTRLARHGTEGPIESGATVRAVGFRDTKDPFNLLLPRQDQLAQIVRLSSDFSIRPRIRPGVPPAVFLERLKQWGIPVHYVPRPVEVERMMLSALGASGRLSSAWDYPIVKTERLDMLEMPVFSVSQWQHVTSQGRDQYVRVVSAGFACWTGHRLSLLEVAERKFHPVQVRTEQTPNGRVPIFGNIAFLRYHKIVVVQEPEKDYNTYADAYQNGGREMPFRKIRLTTLQTPKLDGNINMREPTWISADGHDVQFGVVAEDWDGHQITFTTPLLFVPYTSDGLPSDKSISDSYMGVGLPPGQHPISRNQQDLGNQVVAFASSAGDSTVTHLRTASVRFDLQMPPELKVANLPSNYPLRFLPALKLATVDIPAVSQLLGRSEPTNIELDKAFLEHGFGGPNAKAEAFVALANKNSIDLKFAADKAGGLAKPDMGVDGLTRIMGAVANIEEVKKGNVDVSAFAKAELLGGIKIFEILDGVGFDSADFAPANLTSDALANPALRIKVPMLTTRRTATAVETRYLWKPAIKDFEKILLTRKGEEGNGFPDSAQLILDATLTTPLNGSAPGFRVSGRFIKFALNFADVLKVRIAELTFLSEQGKKPDVSAEGVELIFQGPLEFVNTLRNILPANGFSDPPFVNVDTQGIVAGYTLGVPSVGVGIFSIQNIALSAALSVPFVSKPAGVRFAISERHHPFIVTVALFGGGGFFAMGVSTRGLEQIEAAIEFGGNISLNLGIASGGVYVMAGIYFNMTKQSVALTGYLRCGGHLEVLGIIAISVEFYLMFTYRSKTGGGGEVWGQASVTVCVEVLCFSKSVTLTVERRFAGAAGDPTFEDTVKPDHWAEYCLAFA